MNKLARNTLALGTVTMIVTAGLQFSAQGADATKSYSTGRFLSGSIGGTNLDALAQLRGVTAANPGNAGPNKNPLDLTVLSAIPINLPGGLNLDLAKFLSASGAAGAVNQFASAESTSKAVGASGLVNDSGAVLAPGSAAVPTDAKVSLKSGPLAGINDNLASVDLGLGAVSSNTTVSAGSPSRDYQIAGLNLQLGVPLLGDLIGDLTTAVAPVVGANDITLSPAQLCPLIGSTLSVTSATLLAQLNTLGLGALVALLEPILNNPLLPIANVDLCNVSPLLSVVAGLTDAIDDLIKVNITGLDDLTTGLANFSSGGVDVDLTNGKITLDLEKILTAAGVNLNDLPPNTNLLNYITSDLISGKITTLLDSAIAELVANLGKVNIAVTFAGTAVPLELDDLTGALLPPLVALLDTATDVVAQVGQPIDALLAQLAPNLKQLVELTANNQSTSKAPTLGTGTVNAGSFGAAAVGDYYRTSALKISALGNVVNVDLAASEAAVVTAADTDADGPTTPTPTPTPTRTTPTNSDDADSNADSVADGSDNVDDSDTVADADAQADADVTTTLPSTGAPNLLPFWLLGIALLMFGGAVLLNEKRRLNQI